MSPYTLYNLALAILVLPACYWLVGSHQRGRLILRLTRIAFLMTLMAYPWDFFAISLRAWRYPQHPGVNLYGVPLNDLFFMWVCTQLTCSILIFARRWQSGRKRYTKREDASQ